MDCDGIGVRLFVGEGVVASSVVEILDPLVGAPTALLPCTDLSVEEVPAIATTQTTTMKTEMPTMTLNFAAGFDRISLIFRLMDE